MCPPAVPHDKPEFKSNQSKSQIAMTKKSFNALVLRQDENGTVAMMEPLSIDDLPSGDVCIAVEYSNLNYKDGLAITGTGKVVRSFPMVPGIDFAGTVEKSASPLFNPGDKVILTGWGVGETWWGGFAEKASAKSEWLVALPAGMTTKQAMSYGTAGLTAGLAVNALERHGVDRTREILVTGASGGVGSVAVLMLAQLGYRVVASTGRPEQEAWLKELGAESIIARDVLAAPSKPLLSERWGGVIDTVGSHTLASAMAGVCNRGAVAVCGLAGGADLPTTILPFILRGIAVIGIESVRCPIEDRRRVWPRLASLFPNGLPDSLVQEVSLADVVSPAKSILQGQVRGRIVVRVAEEVVA